ncbi:MAG: hypothetical protein A2675_03620 [Candidatus Yonathbacteria bacterium RIFCSPHIGHO2_01_FULL_51_10]|uniref:Uncharacterized protein n=1 Tax=Candidatus Yonathbacteria bacterium RIFCSPHIGHO2_01_FULL_51_10 TaxID=1802723 RepID=A0A1G2SA01_9BACT|nr:MAG: hypothetical protein A2675_03620 [Candidatus Yonathbacteria bacterium RIFCSPHIGHO2_01_FULL_51_10]
MNTLKKWWHGLAIAVAFMSGSAFGLLIGDTWSAVLSGVALAGSMAWILTLDWTLFHLRFNELSARMSVAGAGKAMGGFLFALGKFIWSVPYSLVVNAAYRRLLVALAFLVGLVMIQWMIWVPILNLLQEAEGRGNFLSLTLSLGLLLLSPSFLAFVIAGAIVFIASPRAYRHTPDNSMAGHDPFGRFMFDWLTQFIESEKSTTFALIDLILIRGWNALRMIVFPFVFAVWGTYVLATKKTGLSAFCAMGLVSIQLAVSHWFGGIITSNPNFWLLLVIGAGVGVWLGGKIHDGLDAKISIWNFQKPKLTFASQQ